MWYQCMTISIISNWNTSRYFSFSPLYLYYTRLWASFPFCLYAILCSENNIFSIRLNVICKWVANAPMLYQLFKRHGEYIFGYPSKLRYRYVWFVLTISDWSCKVRLICPRLIVLWDELLMLVFKVYGT